MPTITRSALLDELFDASRDVLDADFAAYRNHAYRVLNFAHALGPPPADAGRKLEIACFFHDLGIWTDGTFDYLEPSARRAREYLEREGLSTWAVDVTRMITEHHKITSASGVTLVDTFRRADWIDVSLGLVRFGVDRERVAEIRAAFPNQGFHRRLVALGTARLLSHPTNPLPMLKW
jgi:HD domain